MNLSIQASISQTTISCDIKICRGALCSSLELTTSLSDLQERCAIVTDDTVASLYAHKIAEWLNAAHHDTVLVSFPPGEVSKTRATKEKIENQLFAHQCGRDTSLIAIGGGVVTDIGGFVAATFGRGIPLYLLPTTLLGMADAAIGGKNGVNVAWGKNLIGTIYQPRKVLIDPSVIQSLPTKEFRNGLVEMIKHGLVASEQYFEYLETNVNDIRNQGVLDQAIFESCRIKKDIVELDEREQGNRHLLNFGHTFGHALEALSRFKISHGQAVSIGILAESFMAMRLQIMPKHVFERIYHVFDVYKLLVKLPRRLPLQQVCEAMMSDKKCVKGVPRFILLEQIGHPVRGGLCHAEKSIICDAIEWINNVMCGD